MVNAIVLTQMEVMQQDVETAEEGSKAASGEEHFHSYLEDREMRIKSYVLVAIAGAGLLFWCGVVFWAAAEVVKKWGN